mmetsp:Transcript_31060/g.98016  ORF Transcript_31060/g.98016 Transcript_31060/m.98016 type:complete len:329 (+) Transcript_31060:148-1134(+)
MVDDSSVWPLPAMWRPDCRAATAELLPQSRAARPPSPYARAHSRRSPQPCCQALLRGTAAAHGTLTPQSAPWPRMAPPGSLEYDTAVALVLAGMSVKAAWEQSGRPGKLETTALGNIRARVKRAREAQSAPGATSGATAPPSLAPGADTSQSDESTPAQAGPRTRLAAVPAPRKNNETQPFRLRKDQVAAAAHADRVHGGAGAPRHERLDPPHPRLPGGARARCHHGDHGHGRSCRRSGRDAGRADGQRSRRRLRREPPQARDAARHAPSPRAGSPLQVRRWRAAGRTRDRLQVDGRRVVPRAAGQAGNGWLGQVERARLQLPRLLRR